MKLLEIADEFENLAYKDESEKRNFLFRRQASKCREIDMLIHQCGKKFPDWWKTEGYHWGDAPTLEWPTSPSRVFGPPDGNWLLPKVGSDIEIQEIREQFKTKYAAMLQAKREYEIAGGNYKG